MSSLLAAAAWSLLAVNGLGSTPTGPIHGQPAERVVRNEQALAAWSDLKFGMFIHWGIYSTQAGYWDGREIPGLAEHLQRTAGLTPAEYARIARQFYPHRFDPNDWVALAHEAGMRYLVITAKHHDGFCLFDTDTTDYDVVDATPWGRDVLAPLARACRAAGLRLGFYYSQPDWHASRLAGDGHGRRYSVFESISPEMERLMLGQLTQLLTGYGPLCELFFDMGHPTPAQSALWTATVHRLQPNCVVNGRVMNNMGDFLTLNDNALPRYPISQRWEAPSTLYHWRAEEIAGWDNKRFDTWAYKAYAPRPPLDQQLDKQIGKLAMITAKGGNFLLNIGPMADGSVLAYERQVLRGIGDWLRVHGEAIFGTRPGPFRGLEGAWCSVRPGRLYLLIDRWAPSARVRLPGLVNPVTGVTVLGDARRTLAVTRMGADVWVTLAGEAPDPYVSVVALDIEGPVQVHEGLVEVGAPLTVLDETTVRDEIHYENMNFMEMPYVVGQSWRVRFAEPGTYRIDLAAVPDRTPRRQYIEDLDDHFRPLVVPLEGLEFTLSVGQHELRFAWDEGPDAGDAGPDQPVKTVGSVTVERAGIVSIEIRRSDRAERFRRKDYEPMGIDVKRLVLRRLD